MILNFQNLKRLLAELLVVTSLGANALPESTSRCLRDTIPSDPEIISASGTVTKRDGKPLKWAIVWFGMKSYEMTGTDQDGHFRFELIPANALLRCRYIGMLSVCLKPEKSRQMRIVMDYDTLRIGSVPVSAIEQVSGPREVKSNDAADPLIFLDNTQISRHEFDTLDYKRVKDFKIIKDLRALEWYGSRGYHGVIQMVSRTPREQKRLAEWIEHTFSDGLIEPRFPGGEIALREFVEHELIYPEEALKEKIQGKVFVSFHVSLIGKVENPRIARGVHPLLDEEALRIVDNIPDWEPGHLYGKPWSTSFTLPISFSLPGKIPNRSNTLQIPLPDSLQTQSDSTTSQEKKRRWLEKQAQTEEEIIDDFSNFPEFPGGEEGLKRYIQYEFRTSHIAFNEKVEGTVLVSFVVNGFGKAIRVKIIHGLNPMLDEELVRIIRTMPYWKPGKQGGNRKVEVVYTVPINFVLK